MHRKSGSDNLDPSEADRQMALLDLIPLQELQELQDLLANIHNVASVITDADGNLLTLPSNEIPLCRLIRRAPQGFSRCLEVSRSVRAGIDNFSRRLCEPCNNMGILKTAVPIFVDNQHLANWWISQYCGPRPDLGQIEKYADQIGMTADALLDKYDRLPKGDEKQFYNLLDSVEGLTHRMASLVYQNHKLTHNLSDIHYLQDELAKQRVRMEEVIQERTAELIKANNRLQLEVLEKDLAEEQIERKSKLLDAINNILQQTLTDLSDQTLANIFLQAARKLTSSSFGFIAEQCEGRWQVTAIHHPSGETNADASTLQPRESEISEIWRRLREKGKPLSLLRGSHGQTWQPLSKSQPDLRSILVVPLAKSHQISGFVVVADNQEGYAMIDQFDVELLTQAFIETLTRKRVETAKTISEKRLNLALESANEGLWDFDPISGHVYYSPRWFGMLGYMTGEFPDTMETWNTLTHPEDLPTLTGTFASLASKGKAAFSIEVRMLSRTGQWMWLQVRGKTVERNEEGEILRVVGTLIDISKYKQVEVALQKANNELQRLAALDDLTQIANRRRFDDRLGQEWRRAQRDNKYMAVIICDIDYFKKFNDTYGHPQGDQALYAVAQAINNALKRPMDLVARYGGEEFAMILPGTHIAGAERVAKEVKEAVEALNLEHMSSDVSDHITLSFGVAAMIPKPDIASKILIETADRALYRAKAQGRNRIICVSTEICIATENGELKKEPNPIAPPSDPSLDDTQE
jgi:diguanylate cyclase (GGDEF)-like protein/PAS domain S-box-containing protein